MSDIKLLKPKFDQPKAWSTWIADEWPFDDQYESGLKELVKFGTLVGFLRFRYGFDYLDTKAYVERALERTLELGEYDEVMRRFGDHVSATFASAARKP